MKTYSQNKEDLSVLNYFGKDFKGLVLDIGANDGITLSNSRLLIESGWDGVLVEPSPKAYAKLLENKPKTNSQVIALNYAIGLKEEETFLFESAIDKDRFTAVKDFPSFATEEVTKINLVPFLFFSMKSTFVLSVLNASEIAVLLPLEITICCPS